MTANATAPSTPLLATERPSLRTAGYLLISTARSVLTIRQPSGSLRIMFPSSPLLFGFRPAPQRRVSQAGRAQCVQLVVPPARPMPVGPHLALVLIAELRYGVLDGCRVTP